MATNLDFLAYCMSRVGSPYRVGPQRTKVNGPYSDCSGLVKQAATVCGIVNFPTVSQLQLNALEPCSVEEALHTPGALLGHNGYGPFGHIAVSRGNGSQIVEAKGRAWGVLVSSAFGRGLNRAGRVRGLTYVGHTQPGHVESNGLASLAEALHLVGVQWTSRASGQPVVKVGSKGKTVANIQLALNVLSGTRLAIDGQFGPQTQRALMAFQRWCRITADGVAGPQTYRALGSGLLARFH